MKIEKLKLTENLYLIAVTDKKDKVIAAGAFTYQEEADTAAAIINTLLTKKEKGTIKLSDLMKIITEG